MKRSWIGAGLLLVLLVLSWGLSWGMGAVHAPVAVQLHRASEERDWMAAKKAAEEAMDGWGKWKHFRLCLADHTPVEQIDAQLARLERTGDMEEFTALAAETAQMIAAIADSHRLNLWNFF